MLKTAEEYAAGVGYQSLYLETHTNLEIAIHLYEKAGFHEIEKPQFLQCMQQSSQSILIAEAV